MRPTYSQLAPFIKYFAARYQHIDARLDYDDLVQDCWLSWLHGGRLSSLPHEKMISQAVRWEMSEIVSKTIGNKHSEIGRRKRDANFISYKELAEINREVEVENTDLTLEDLIEILAQIAAQLEERNRNIFYLALSGVQQTEIGRKYGLNKSAISMIISNIRNRIKKKLSA